MRSDHSATEGEKKLTARARTFGFSRAMLRVGLVFLAASSIVAVPMRAFGTEGDLHIALGLADMLRAARTVIATNQDRINDPSIGDKGLSGKIVLNAAIENFEKSTGQDPRDIDPGSRYGRLLSAQMAAIGRVMDDNQGSINKAGVGFKGFVPAVFARLVNEHFRQLIGSEAQVKVTAPPDQIRNRKARPDPWEVEAIRIQLLSEQWVKGEVYFMDAMKDGRDAFRVLVPEYYTAGCLACHGEPKGETDVTGYPKEGGKLGELGGVISVTLFR
jgi:hypothetical protein